jgi:heptosyltransferase I
VPLVAIFVGSEPSLTGPVGSGPISVLGGMGLQPSIEDVAGQVKRVTAALPVR